MRNPNEKISRRNLLRGLASSALLLSNARLVGQDTVPRIRITLSYAIGLWYFNPVGLYLEKGQTAEWMATRWGPTVTAFHPSNGNQELRIPEAAEPFDSGVLAREDTFRWTFDVEGTYDYFSKNHLGMGVVGRIVVGNPGGPGEMPPRYGGAQGRAPIYPRAMPVFDFLDSQEIVRQKTVSFPTDRLGQSYPEY